MLQLKVVQSCFLIPKHLSLSGVDQESWIQGGSKHLVTQLILTELHSRSDVVLNNAIAFFLQ